MYHSVVSLFRMVQISNIPQSNPLTDQQAIDAFIERLEASGVTVADAAIAESSDDRLAVTVEVPRPTADDPFAPERDECGNLDHTDPRHLAWAYENARTLQEAADEFEPCYDTVRYWMVQQEIHTPDYHVE